MKRLIQLTAPLPHIPTPICGSRPPLRVPLERSDISSNLRCAHTSCTDDARSAGWVIIKFGRWVQLRLPQSLCHLLSRSSCAWHSVPGCHQDFRYAL